MFTGGLHVDGPGQQHLASVLAKYQNSIANFELVNGEPLLGARKLSARELARFGRKRDVEDEDEWADDKDWAGWDDKVESSENGEGPEDWEDEEISGWPLNAAGSEDVASVDGTTDVDADNSPFADVDPIQPASNVTSTEDESDDSNDSDGSDGDDNGSEQSEDEAGPEQQTETDDEGDEDWSEADSDTTDDDSSQDEEPSDEWVEDASGEDDVESQEDWVVLDTSDFTDLDGPAEAPTVAEAFSVSSRQFSGNPRAILPAAPRFDTWKRINSVAEVDIVEKPVAKRAPKTTKAATTGTVPLTDYQDGLRASS